MPCTASSWEERQPLQAAHAGDNPRPTKLLLQQPEHEKTSAWSLILSWMRKSIPCNGSLKLIMNKSPVYLRDVYPR